MSFQSSGVGGFRSAAGRCGAWIGDHPVLASLAASLALALVLLLRCTLSYQDCDDILLLMMSKGVGVADSPVVMNGRMNVTLSFALASLYRALPSVQWYSVLSVGTILLSLWGTLLALLWTGPGRGRKLALWIAGSAIDAFFLGSMQWTTTSALAGTAAVFLFYVALRSEKHAPGWFLGLAGFLTGLSAWIRPESFFLVALLAAPLGAALLWKKSVLPENRRTLRAAGLALGVALAGVAADKAAYELDPAWRSSMAFFHAHFDLNEARGEGYTFAHQPLFDAVGWSENDERIFRAWYFLDPDLFSVAKIERLCAGLPRVTTVKKPDEGFPALLRRQTSLCLLVSLFALGLILPRRERGRAALDLAWTAGVLVFLWLGYKLPLRVFLPCLFFLWNVLLLRAFDGEEGGGAGAGRGAWRFGLALALVLAVNLAFAHAFTRKMDAWGERQAAFEKDLASFHPDPGKLYALWEMSFPYTLLRPFNDYEVFRGWNTVSLTWLQRFPVTRRMLERFGVKDLFRDMVDNPRLLLVCNDTQALLYRTYLFEHGGLMTHLSPVYTSREFNVYEVKSGY